MIINEEEEEKMPQEVVHQRELASTFRSKAELWRFLVGDGEVYLPITKNCTM